MGELQIAVTTLGVIAVVLLSIAVACHFLGPWVAAWVRSTREEKVGLARMSGHYNANGYLIHSDSDINLDATGSFRRFDSVDRDYQIPLATSSISGLPWSADNGPDIPPQPLRPAPTPQLPAPNRPAPQPPPGPGGLETYQVIPDPPDAVPTGIGTNGTTYRPPPDGEENTYSTQTNSIRSQVQPGQGSRQTSVDKSNVVPRPIVNTSESHHRRTASLIAPPRPLPSARNNGPQTASPQETEQPKKISTNPFHSEYNIQSGYNDEQLYRDTQELKNNMNNINKDGGYVSGYVKYGNIFDAREEKTAISPEEQNKFSEPIATSNERRTSTEEGGKSCNVFSASERRSSRSSIGERIVGALLRQNSTGGEDSDGVSGVEVPLKRAVSCESVCSDSSVALGDLEEPHIKGYLCIGLQYDRSGRLGEGLDLVVTVLEARDLVGPEGSPFDTYVRVHLLPDKNASMQTKVCRNTNSPSYKEKFMFWLPPRGREPRQSLWFNVYHSGVRAHTLIGGAELRLSDVNKQPVTTWLALSDSGKSGCELGELMFSLSYLPTAERLTAVVVKARNLRGPAGREPEAPFVKVYLLQNGKKVHKKRTSIKRGERSPIFNEAMMFSVPPHMLHTVQIRLTVAESPTGATAGSRRSSATSGDAPRISTGRAVAVGHVIVGSQASGKAHTHWNQMLSALRKPIAMWHPLRRQT